MAGTDRVIGHKEYAGAAQGKVDPANMDMTWFRREAAKAANVGRNLPDLVIHDLATERRHPVRAAFNNRRENLLRIAAINPLVIH